MNPRQDAHQLGWPELDGLSIGIYSLRQTAINDAIRNGVQMQEMREFAGHSDIRTTELEFVRKEDAEMAARRIQIRVPLSGKVVFGGQHND